MTRNEIIDLLTVAAAFDQRTIGESDVIAWTSVLDDADFARARAAVIAWYREQSRRIMPADIRQHIRASTRPELTLVAALPAGEPEPPNEDYLAAKTSMLTALKARDTAAMAPASERATAWIDAHAGPSRPVPPPFGEPPGDLWVELPGDPPELRDWLAWRREQDAQ